MKPHSEESFWMSQISVDVADIRGYRQPLDYDVLWSIRDRLNCKELLTFFLKKIGDLSMLIRRGREYS
ncbi:hypothetical protein TNCV_2529021 [Trichonephila clavipes]|nr:hypothetical protein TNCV_2529021 [Trichonephila clavipes]